MLLPRISQLFVGILLVEIAADANALSSLVVADISTSLDFVRDNLIGKASHVLLESHLQRVDEEHERDVRNSPFVTESPMAARSRGVNYADPPNFERVCVAQRNVAVRSTQPLLSKQQRASIISAAEDMWNHPSGQGSSRFTIQRPGNFEAHTAELGAGIQESILNPLLQDQIYPWLRNAFSCEEVTSSFCVYDSLVIRYNATQAKLFSQTMLGASQPLHKDLGLFSVNILLSEPQNFQGGGTFFENQLLLDEPSLESVAPLQPLGAGGALAHPSSERHAGAATTSGVRDILVFFIMATDRYSLRTPRLKGCLAHCASVASSNGDPANFDTQTNLDCRLQHHYLACRNNPNDGEALLYLSTILMELAKMMNEERQLPVRQAARELLIQAAALCPCDARIWNNLGIVTNRLAERQEDLHHELWAATEATFTTCLDLLERSQAVGCDVAADWKSCRLNFGLFLANLDRFDEATNILAPLAEFESALSSGDNDLLIQQASSLLQFCKRQIKLASQ